MNRRDPSDPAVVAAMAVDAELRHHAERFVLDACRYRYPYNFTWLGLPVIQFPQDLIALQELLFRVRPQIVVETGIAHGGGTVFLASILELLGGDGKVIAVDVDIRAHNREAIQAHPLSKRIELVEGSSTDPTVIAHIKERVGTKIAFVVLDSDHTRAHVLAELRAYGPLVRRGSYIVVLDTIVERMSKAQIGDRPWSAGNSPMTAVHEFLREDSRFSIDRDLENTLLITVAPEGYLRCDRDP
ncbi:MAG TPA: CmcI family methyltransferase [Candidatus Binatus sp.]|nr:CmcI family methyltransferase [Candidatus Binatus sp.]